MRDRFDEETSVRTVGDGAFETELSSSWLAGPALCGGYGMVIALRAMATSLPQPDPVSVTAHFLGPLAPGPAHVRIDVVKSGRSVSSGQAAVSQGGRERLRLMSMFGHLAAGPVSRHMEGGPPDLPPPEVCVGNELGAHNEFRRAMWDHFEYRVPPDAGGTLTGRRSGKTMTRAWIRMAGGREPDLLALVAVVDALPPVIWEIGVVGWVPTLELTIHLRAHPAPGWLRIAARTRFVQGRLFEEDAEIWDSQDRLVAQSRQLAVIPE